MKNFKTLILSGCAAAVVMPVLPLSAQSIDEIVVTARRQTESLRDVPASVSVLTADALEKTGAQIAEDFVQLTPGVTIVTGTAEVGDTQINIRGMNGARDAESSVALPSCSGVCIGFSFNVRIIFFSISCRTCDNRRKFEKDFLNLNLSQIECHLTTLLLHLGMLRAILIMTS